MQLHIRSPGKIGLHQKKGIQFETFKHSFSNMFVTITYIEYALEATILFYYRGYFLTSTNVKLNLKCLNVYTQNLRTFIIHRNNRGY